MGMTCIDLFCGGGGAAIGYIKAGYKCYGVDINPQPNYPGRFVQGDWYTELKFLINLMEFEGSKFFIHASPPCQAYSKHVTSRSSKWNHTKGKDEPALIPAVRYALQEACVPYVIENVAGAKAHLLNPIMLCGTMFDLPLPRHRYFETSFYVPPMAHPKCRGVAKAYAAEHGWDYRDMSVTGKGRRTGTAGRWKQILGIEPGHAMTQHQLAECIPPAYTEYIGGWVR